MSVLQCINSVRISLPPTKWIYSPALSALVHCSNEIALNAHHLSACQPVLWFTVHARLSEGARVLGLTLSHSQILSKAGCVI